MILQAFKTKDGKFRLKKQSSETFNAYLTGLKPMADFEMKVLTDADRRSLQQSRFYWSLVLKCCQYYLNELEWCADPKDKEIAHYQMKLNYCTYERPDLIEINRFKHPKTGKIEERAVPFSWSMEKMPHKEATAYIEWCKKRVMDQCRFSWDDAVRGVEL